MLKKDEVVFQHYMQINETSLKKNVKIKRQIAPSLEKTV